MSKSLLGLFITLFFVQGLRAEQPQFTISSASGNPGEIVSINFTVDDFTSLVSAQFSIQWDPEVLEYEAITNLNTNVSGLNANAFNVTTYLADGQITFLWLEPSVTPVNLPDGSVLFTLQLQVIGEPCDVSNIAITEIPSEIEVIEEPGLVEVDLTSNVGQVTVPGSGCSEDIVFIGENVVGPCGGESCIEFTVQNFTDVAVMQFALEYDPSILEFDRVQNYASLPAFGNGNTFSPSPGIINVVWTNGNAENSSLPDGTVLFEICFNVVGTGGQVSTITFSDTPPVEITDVSTNPHTVSIQPASITAQCSLEGFALISNEGCTEPGGVVCLDISVNDFENLIAAQFSINWDSTKFVFESIEALNLPDLEEGSFGLPGNPGVKQGQLGVLWLDFATEGVTVPDNTVIFQLCLRAVGAAGTSSIISFTHMPTEIEIASNDSTLNYTLVNGRARIETNCENPPCELSYTLNVTDPACPGEASGSINLSVNTDGCTGTPTFLWSNGFTTEDISGLPAGTYSVTITLDQQIVVATDMVVNPPAIGVTSTISNPDPVGSSTGGVNITVTGGTPPYNFLWNTNPAVTTEDLVNVPSGSYVVTITDSRGCVFVPDPFIVGADIAGSVTDATCAGACDGSITVTGAFGTAPYTYSWNTNPVQTTSTISNLCAGDYCVTITDNAGASRDTCFTVDQLSTGMTLTADVTHDTNENGQGAIDLNVVGGANPLSYVWSNGLTSQDLINLSQGEYCVTVTDGNGCTATACFDVFAGGVNVDLTAKPYGNFQTSCGDRCDGEITAEVSGGVAPYTYRWSNNATTPDLVNLCAGVYTVTVTDADGNTTVRSQTITSPPVLSFTEIITEPTDITTSDGAISLVATGGVGPLSFEWTGPVSGSGAAMTNLPSGTYRITVTDANGCEFTRNILLIPIDFECYQANKIITPNDDGKNDFFVLTCIFDLNNRLFIFNRNGGLVYETANYDNSWNGVDEDNQPVADGGYLWVLEVRNNDGSLQVLKGTVNVLRTAD